MKLNTSNTKVKINDSLIKKILKNNNADYIEYKSTTNTLVITKNPFNFLNVYKDTTYKGVNLQENPVLKIGGSNETKKSMKNTTKKSMKNTTKKSMNNTTKKSMKNTTKKNIKIKTEKRHNLYIAKFFFYFLFYKIVN